MLDANTFLLADARVLLKELTSMYRSLLSIYKKSTQTDRDEGLPRQLAKTIV